MRILILPGLGCSGENHWQTQWERAHPSWKRVEQEEWNRPQAERWMEQLQSVLSESNLPTILVAHSLACVLTARWAMQHTGPVAGAFLVAPSDVDAPGFPEGTSGFKPMPMHRLPFPTMLIASTNDFYASEQRSRAFAEAWGSELVVLGERDHIGEAADLGMWPEGMALFERFCSKLVS